MDNSTTADTRGKITITETFDIAQAICEASSLSRQSLHINYRLEQLASKKELPQREMEEAYDLTFQVSRNLEQMKAILAQLDEMILVEKSAQEVPA